MTMRARLIGLVQISVLMCLAQQPVSSQEAAVAKPPSPEVQEFVRLLDNPAVRTWLEAAKGTPDGAPPVRAAVPPSNEDAALTQGMANHLSDVREHLHAVAAALPRFPEEARQASARVMGEINRRGLFGILVLLIGFAALGYGTEQVFWRATSRTRAWIGQHPMNTVLERLRMVGMRLGFGLALVAIFGIGSIGAFLIFDWPPLLREIILSYLLALLATRLAIMILRVFLVPNRHGLGDPERYRLIPMPDRSARYWYRHLTAFVGYFAFGWATVDVLGVVGFSLDLRRAAAYLLGL